MDKLEQEIWKTNYVQPMFEKYKEIPTKLKYMFIEKEYCKMFGKSEGLSQMRYMYDDTETFIFAFESALCEFGKVARKKNKTEEKKMKTTIYSHKKGGKYIVLRPFKFKFEGVWYDSILYSDIDSGEVYGRVESAFDESFKLME